MAGYPGSHPPSLGGTVFWVGHSVLKDKANTSSTAIKAKFPHPFCTLSTQSSRAKSGLGGKRSYHIRDLRGNRRSPETSRSSVKSAHGHGLAEGKTLDSFRQIPYSISRRGDSGPRALLQPSLLAGHLAVARLVPVTASLLIRHRKAPREVASCLCSISCRFIGGR